MNRQLLPGRHRMMKSKFKVKYSGTLKLHWQWNVILALTLLVLDVAILAMDYRAGLVTLAFSAVYFLGVLGMYFHYKPRILRGLVNFATGYGQVQKQILQEFEIPAALLEPDGKILWMNDRMYELTEKSGRYKKNISTLIFGWAIKKGNTGPMSRESPLIPWWTRRSW